MWVRSIDISIEYIRSNAIFCADTAIVSVIYHFIVISKYVSTREVA